MFLITIFTLSTLHSFEAVASSFHRQTMWLGVLKTRDSCAFNAPKIIANGALRPKLTESASATQNYTFVHKKPPWGTPSLIW